MHATLAPAATGSWRAGIRARGNRPASSSAVSARPARIAPTVVVRRAGTPARFPGRRLARAASGSIPEPARDASEASAEEDDEPPPPPPFDVPAAPPACLTAPEKLRARDVVAEVIRVAARDFFPASMLICVAGAAAQTLNLAGTFVLAILNVHDVEIVAALFLLCVQFWKLCCENLAKIAHFRNARDVDAGDASRFHRLNALRAWDAVREAYASWRLVLFIDARRLLSIAWNSVITIPIPYLGVVKLLDYALCVPVFLFEGKTGAECLKRSQELMLGNRLLLLRAAMGLGGAMSLAVGVIVGAFAAIVPTLPGLLMQPAVEASAAAGVEGGGVQVGDAAAGIFTGTAFDRVWDVGTLTEKWATVLLLTFAVAGSFVFTTTLRQLLYVFYRETRARWKPPPPPEPPKEGGGVRGFFAKMAFWKKVEEGDTSEAVAARTAELARRDAKRDGDGGEEGVGKPAA